MYLVDFFVKLYFLFWVQMNLVYLDCRNFHILGSLEKLLISRWINVKFLSFNVYVTIKWCMLVMCYTGKVIITNNVDTTTAEDQNILFPWFAFTDQVW